VDTGLEFYRKLGTLPSNYSGGEICRLGVQERRLMVVHTDTVASSGRMGDPQCYCLHSRLGPLSFHLHESDILFAVCLHCISDYDESKPPG